MSAHDPKASMYAIVTTSTPKVAKPRSAMPTPSIGALLVAKGMKLGFSEEVATIAAMKMVADAAKAAAAREALANPPPKPVKPPRSMLFTEEHHEKRKARVLELLAHGWLFWSDLRERATFGRPVMQRVVRDLELAGLVSVIKRRGCKVVGLVTATTPTASTSAPPIVVPPPSWAANARKPCTIDGIDFVSRAAAAIHFNVSCYIAGKYAKRGTSAAMVRTVPAKYKAREKGASNGNGNGRPCTIDGVTYASQRDAGIALKASKREIRRWSIAGESSVTQPHTTRPKECIIDGITFPTQTAVAAYFNVAYQTAIRYAERGTSVAPVRVVVPKPAVGEASRRPCTIDGVTYESKLAARIALKVGKDTISRWAIDGKSAPVRRGRHATAAQAFDHARTRKNSQTPSSGAISQSGAQMWGL